MRVEPIASMSVRRRLSESSCSFKTSSLEVRRKDASLIKTKYKFKMDISKRLYA